MLTADPQNLVIDGITYRWRIEDDPLAGSTDMSHRGVDLQTVAITGDEGSSIRFVLPEHDLRSRGWWRGPRRLTPEVIERAVRIARRNSNETVHRLVDNDVSEAFDGPPTTLQDDLDVASAACRVLARGNALGSSTSSPTRNASVQ